MLRECHSPDVANVTCPNVMLSPQCLPIFSLAAAGGGRNTVLDRDPPSFFLLIARLDSNLWVRQQPGTCSNTL